MKTKLEFLKWTMVTMMLASAPGAWSQVGTLTKTGAMTVCTTSTESFGVVPTAGSTYSWGIIAGSGGMGTIINGPAPNNLISVNWTGSGTCTLQVIESNGTCTGNPVTILITVLPGLLSGTAAADQTICYNSSPLPITSTAPTGGDGTYSYQWESSIDGGATWVSLAGANSLTYAPGALTRTTLYHLVETSGGSCGTVTTNTVTITVQSQIITSPIWHR